MRRHYGNTTVKNLSLKAPDPMLYDVIFTSKISATNSPAGACGTTSPEFGEFRGGLFAFLINLPEFDVGHLAINAIGGVRINGVAEVAAVEIGILELDNFFTIDIKGHFLVIENEHDPG
ncbi:MAG: hypothetical protein K8R77_03755 [Anaerolineaceae bacterium]|nr:hypothetical protein [Anaerolineaceae bacterium]